MQYQWNLFVLITQIYFIQRRKKSPQNSGNFIDYTAPRHNTYRENEHLSEVLQLPVFS